MLAMILAAGSEPGFCLIPNTCPNRFSLSRTPAFGYSHPKSRKSRLYRHSCQYSSSEYANRKSHRPAKLLDSGSDRYEPEILGTGGAMKNAADFFDDRRSW